MAVGYVLWRVFILAVLVLIAILMGLYELFSAAFEWFCNQVEIELKRQQAELDAGVK